MIRRDANDSSGALSWVLVPQIEHARLAGRILRRWRQQRNDSNRPPLFAEPQLVAELNWATDHHDDGWGPWDQDPGLDDQGRPRSFREMNAAESAKIWTRSIRLAEARGPLAAFFVARHFLDLAGEDPEDQAFRAQQTPSCSDNLQRWLGSEPGRAVGRAQTLQACEMLQIFDWLSLLLCVGNLSESIELPLPSGSVHLLTTSDPCRFLLDPWPGQPENRSAPPTPHAQISWQFQAVATQVPAKSYTSVNQLRRASRPCRLQWWLAPKSLSTRNN